MLLRRLLCAGILSALLLCGWGGVFAAAVCPHAATHLCCLARLKPKEEKATAPHCHKQSESRGDAHEAAQNSHDALHTSQPSHETAHAAREGRAEGGPVREGARAAWAVGSFGSCAHCVNRPERPNAPVKSSGVEGARREQSRPVRHVHAPQTPAFASFAPSVIPVQGSPPGSTRLHLLLGVFLI